MSEPDLTACDREPIHIPESIQPHGLLLVVDRDLLTIGRAAGDVEGRLGLAEWQGAPLAAAIGDELSAVAGRAGHSGGAVGYVGQLRTARELFDVHTHRAGDAVVVELEPGQGADAPPSSVLAALEAAGASFQRATSLGDLCDRAAREFRKATGFDRVMIHRFLDDEAGKVLAEDRAGALPSFMNHHFPGSDIPKQARALYLRNLVRVIPNVSYAPEPLRPAQADAPLDMSDCALRSVSPVHLAYMQNMGVAASASVSIVVDGELWGLVACHNVAPRLLTYDLRSACRTLAGGLARQIKARQESEAYRERVRLRALEDEVRDLLSRADTLEAAISEHMGLVQRMLGADSFALVAPDGVRRRGESPDEGQLRALATWVEARTGPEVFVSDRLSGDYPAAAAFENLGSGLLALSGPIDEPMVLMWLRAERIQVVEWAGNPHKAVADAGGQLRPRASFDAWRETVRGSAEPWSGAEIEAALRFRQMLLDLRRQRRLKDLNARLSVALMEQEGLLRQKEVLLREMNHRVQNSLQLVSSFLALQGRASNDAVLQAALEEARRRLGAVALVHRRLYRADQIESIDMARYVEELWADMAGSLDPAWTRTTTLSLEPVSVATDRAVTLGLVLTELIINANKYAYGGAPGPLEIALISDGRQLEMVVADRGAGRDGGQPAKPGSGFGGRMMSALIGQLGGTLEFEANAPGTRAVVRAPLRHS